MDVPRDAFGRLVPPKEWELALFGLAMFTAASVPVNWLLHGATKVQGAWIALPLAMSFAGLGLLLRRKRVRTRRPILWDETNSADQLSDAERAVVKAAAARGMRRSFLPRAGRPD